MADYSVITEASPLAPRTASLSIDGVLSTITIFYLIIPFAASLPLSIHSAHDLNAESKGTVK